MDARKSAIFAFLSGKPILQTIKHLIQTVSEIQFWSVKSTNATIPYAKISSISIPSHQDFSSRKPDQAMQTIEMVS